MKLHRYLITKETVIEGYKSCLQKCSPMFELISKKMKKVNKEAEDKESSFYNICAHVVVVWKKLCSTEILCWCCVQGPTEFQVNGQTKDQSIEKVNKSKRDIYDVYIWAMYYRDTTIM